MSTSGRRDELVGGGRLANAPAILHREMKSDIHPNYDEALVTCTCGNQFTTRSTKKEIHVEICSQCHPIYTSRPKLVDTGGRIENFPRSPTK